jgi:hypothetical protein
VLLNEIAASESNDWIELYNPGDSAETMEHWYLSDDIDELDKWAIPAVTIPSRGYISFDEIGDFHTSSADGFGLSRAGEQVFLSYLPGTAEDRVADCLDFEAQEAGTSLGRYPDGGPYWFRMNPTRDTANEQGLSDLVISEIMYHPADPNEEYLELYNPTAEEILLETPAGSWQLDGGVEFRFAAGLSIPAGGRLVVVGFDPEAEPSRLDAFVTAYGTGTLVAGVNVVGPWSGNLSNSSERLALEKPLAGDEPDEEMWAIVDEVAYGDTTPWPSAADGAGAALQRIDATGQRSGNAPDNWHAGPPTPGY